MSFFKKLFGNGVPKEHLDNQPQPVPPEFTREGVRATYKHREYFDTVWTSTQQRLEGDIAMYEKLISEKGENFDKHKLSEFIISRRYQILFEVGYSRGDRINDLKPLFTKCVDHFLKAWDKEDDVYNQALTVLSVAVLLDLEATYFKKIYELFKNNQYNDYLLDYLLSYQVNSIELTPALLFSDDKALAALQRITTVGQDEAQKAMKLFLDKQWYTKQNLGNAYNTHLQNDGYFGYWAFEAAAITKIMKLDDSSYQKNEFYPYDLAH